ncbi:SUMO-conjugating enzyme UBC9-B [Drosophila madeirensis]|uniref:SUMO-conjugating enzyme UBC9-B n=1 Tax=Drosophila madeirensis TaxID=30013 RepID=A0AAU9G0K8_DROMD
MPEFALHRLIQECAEWRQAPVDGFAAHPAESLDGTLNYMVWNCTVPGEEGTEWQYARYNLQLTFDTHYPASMPQVRFELPIFHPNVNSGRYLALPKFDPDIASPSISIRNILWGVQCQMDMPDVADESNEVAHHMLCCNPDNYYINVRQQSLRMAEQCPSLQKLKDEEIDEEDEDEDEE